MPDLPAVAPSLWSLARSPVETLRSLDAWAFGWVTRAAGLLRPSDFNAGHDFAGSQPQLPMLDARVSMSAYREFAWIVAATNAIAFDLARLPIRVSIGRGRKAKILDDHPVIRLLQRPSARTRGGAFRRQRMIDLLLAGHRATLKVYGRNRSGPPESLLRLHPIRTKPIPSRSGEIEAFEYEGGGSATVRYDWRACMHMALPSWEDEPTSLNGQSLVAPLRRELNIDLAIQRNSERAAKKGRPDGIVSPGEADAAGGWTPKQTKEFRAELEEMFAAAAGGMAILGRKVDVTKLGWSPVDLGTLDQRGFTRETILATFGVPPVRMGLETANFATADKQLEMYWGDTLQGLANIDDEDLTDLAREFPDSQDVEVWHDFSDVPALQASQTARLSRVGTHISNGMEEAAAYDYEGFSDAPIGAKAPKPAPAPMPAPAPPQAEPNKALEEWMRGGPTSPELTRWWTQRGEEAPPVPSFTAEERAAREVRWRGWVERVHAKAENRVRRAIRGFLDKQLARVLDRLPTEHKADALYLQRNAIDELVNSLFPSQIEDEALRSAMRDVLRRALLDGFESTVDSVGEPLSFVPGRSDPRVEAQLAELVADVNATTKSKIRDLVVASRNQGETMNELQKRLQDLVHDGNSFSPSRSLRIARTETTECIEAGNQIAYEDYAAAGVDLDKEWLTAHDANVREEHQALDGVVVAIGAVFEIRVAGLVIDTAPHPGAFRLAKHCVNCRCTTVPKRRAA